MLYSASAPYKIARAIVVILALFIGIYPFLYLLIDMSKGFLQSKQVSLLQSDVWQTAFHIHIFAGGTSLLTGWSQFNRSWRTKWANLHRTLGKSYVFSVCLSGFSAIYLSLFANGGLISTLGFGMLALLWLVSTILAYRWIRRGDVFSHQQWMARSYALTFAAVTLRLWLPFLGGVLNMEFIPSYRLVSWLCWVPNLFLAEILIRRSRKNRTAPGLMGN